MFKRNTNRKYKAACLAEHCLKEKECSSREQQCMTQERQWWARSPRGYGHTQIFVAVCSAWDEAEALSSESERERERGVLVLLCPMLPTPAAYMTSTAGVPKRTAQKKKCQRVNRERCLISQTLRNVASCVRFSNKHHSAALSSLPRGTAQHSFTCSPPTATSAQQASHQSGWSVSLMRQ